MKSISRLHYFTQENILLSYEEQIKLVSSCECDFVHLKVENSNEEAYLKIAQKCIQITHENNVKLIVWDYPEVAKKIDADGIHFTELNNFSLKYFKKLKEEFTLSCSVTL